MTFTLARPTASQGIPFVYGADAHNARSAGAIERGSCALWRRGLLVAEGGGRPERGRRIRCGRDGLCLRLAGWLPVTAAKLVERGATDRRSNLQRVPRRRRCPAA